MSPRFGGVAVVVQLGLVVALVERYDVAARPHLFPVMLAVLAGYVVRLAVPARLRLAFFGLLSAAVVVMILGWPNGPLVLGLGGLLIAVCYLPVPFAVRLALVGLLALGLVGLRVDYDEAFWPVLGSMLMLRLISLLYELRRERPPLAAAVAYFFPLHNVSFLFFPIVDFKTFRDTYRPDADWRAAQVGVDYLGRWLSPLL